MNKIFLSASAIAMLMAASSCSQEDVMNPATGGDGNVNFTVQLPGGMGTRSFSDGYSATKLKAVVYDSETGSYIQDKETTFDADKLTTTISFNLAAGANYKIAFFADNDKGVYDMNMREATVTVDYSKMTAYNSVDYDCFYKIEEIKVTDALSKSIVLERPVAQINWGTNDLSEASVTTDKAYGENAANLWTKVSVRGADNVLNLISGKTSKADGFSGEFVFGAEKRPTTKTESTPDGEKYPVDNYDYLSMQYLLAPAANSVVDLELTSHNNEAATTAMSTVTVASAPLQANYRTNIYGALLTKPADFTVEKKPGFAGDDINKEVWDGKPGNLVADANGNYTISNPAQLAALAQIVNNGNNLYGKTVTLTADIDLCNQNWTPIGTKKNVFNGKFDGQNHTISNLKIDLSGKDAVPAGLFGWSWQGQSEFRNVTIDGVDINVLGATGKAVPVGSLFGGGTANIIEGITVKNVNIKSYRQTGGVVGQVYGNIKDCKAENISIELSFEYLGNKYDNCDKAGAIAGQIAEEIQYLTGNSANNVKITGYRDFGGLFGHVNNAKTEFKNNSITDANLVQTLEHAYENEVPTTINGLIGRINDGMSIDDSNTATNVKVFKSVKNADDFKSALEQGGKIDVPADAVVDFASSGSVAINNDVELNIEGTIKTARQNNIANIVVGKDAKLTISGGGTFSGDNRIIDVNGELIVKDANFVTSTKTRGAAITVNDGGKAVFDGGNITAANCAVWVEGNFEMNGGKIVSTNSSSDPEVVNNGWSYAVRAISEGCNITINGGEVEGVQGAVGAYSGNIIINDGYFHTHPKYGKSDNYYALYVGDKKATCTVNGGKFYAEGKPDIYFVNNHASLDLKGGMCEDKGKEVTGNDSEQTIVKGDLTPVKGCEWKAVKGDPIFKWEVVKN